MNKKDNELLQHLNLSINNFKDTLNRAKSIYLTCNESEKKAVNNLMIVTEKIIKELNDTILMLTK